VLHFIQQYIAMFLYAIQKARACISLFSRFLLEGGSLSLKAAADGGGQRRRPMRMTACADAFHFPEVPSWLPTCSASMKLIVPDIETQRGLLLVASQAGLKELTSVVERVEEVVLETDQATISGRNTVAKYFVKNSSRVTLLGNSQEEEAQVRNKPTLQ
jgi:hypothetical protein